MADPLSEVTRASRHQLTSARTEGFIGAYQLLAGEHMDVVHLNQKQLATRWAVSEATLERWRSVGIGPVFLKLSGQVRYRVVDIKAFEESCLASSTKSVIRD